MKPAPRLAWLIPLALLALIWLCALLGRPRYPATAALQPATVPAPGSPAPTVAATRPAETPIPAPSPDWAKLADAALDACERWQQRANELAGQRKLTADLSQPGSSTYRQDGVLARDDRERFAYYDAEGKVWRTRALALEALPPLLSLPARDFTSPAHRSASSELPSDEEIAEQARANVNTYAPPTATGPATAGTPWVDPASKTQHVRSYTRANGTQVESYNRRPTGPL